MINISKYSHDLLGKIKNANISIDMTCGNGYDTLYLASISKSVFAFDIQDLAIENTKKLLKDKNVNNVKVIKESHDLYDIYINDPIDLAIYNLGYLPKGNKEIKTESNVVVNSLKKLIKQLNINGMIVIVIYLHTRDESIKIEELVSHLDSCYDVIKHQVLNKENCPYIIEINRVKE